MFTGPSHRSHRSSRAAKRRRRPWRTIISLLGVLLVATAFAGGFFWRSGKEVRVAREEQREPIDRAARFEARRLLDEGVRARYEERWQGAYNAVNEARRLDPDLSGVDLFVAEIAWEQRQATAVRRAARESLRRGHSESASKLLIALQKWMSRGAQETVTVGASVRELLAEASEASFSSAAALFFHGELSRLLGDNATAHRALLGALHRQTPWTSTALLATKLQFAAAEAAQLGRSAVAPVPDDQAQAALDLRNAMLAGGDARAALKELLLATPSLQAVLLLQDAVFQSGGAGEALHETREQLNSSVPHGGS